MRLILAFKAFCKALRDPQGAEEFLAGKPPQKQETGDPAHLRLLNHLQQAGRLIDFLKEDISAFSDAQVGAAVRKVHQDCGQLIEELVTVRPLRSEAEGAHIQIPQGYNPAEIKIVGHVKGEPPFNGILIHRGWKAHKRSLPKRTSEGTEEIIYPAEVEVK